MARAGTFYTASAGDSGHGAEYPAASPNVTAVGGTTLNGCSGTSCAGFSSETAWSGSGGGASAVEPGQSGWFTVGGTSVGAPNWAGILAAGRSAGSTALQGDSAIYSGGYKTNLRDITSGTNGSCGTDCPPAPAMTW